MADFEKIREAAVRVELVQVCPTQMFGDDERNVERFGYESQFWGQVLRSPYHFHESYRSRITCQQRRRCGFAGLPWPADTAIQPQPKIVNATGTKRAQRRTPLSP